MRIKLANTSRVYSSLDGIIKSAASSAIAFVEQLLQVERAGLTITVPRCFDLDVPASDQNTFLPYDLVIYAAATQQNNGGNISVSGVACQLSQTAPHRPVVGRLKYYTNYTYYNWLQE
jgi:hypothetical protein